VLPVEVPTNLRCLLQVLRARRMFVPRVVPEVAVPGFASQNEAIELHLAEVGPGNALC